MTLKLDEILSLTTVKLGKPILVAMINLERLPVLTECH